MSNHKRLDDFKKEISSALKAQPNKP
jgi:hypothetical protein